MVIITVIDLAVPIGCHLKTPFRIDSRLGIVVK